MELTPLDTSTHKEDTANDIKNAFGPSIEMSTREGLVVAGKTQQILTKEMEDREEATKFVEMVKPYLSEGVKIGMNWLKRKRSSHKDATKTLSLPDYLLTLVNWPTKKELFKLYNKNHFAKQLKELTASKKTYPNDLQVIHKYMTYVILPMMHEFMLSEIEEFRRQNPQLSDCKTSLVAAQVYGSLKMEILSMTKEFIEGMTESDIDEGAAGDYVLEKLMESIPRKLEEAGEEIGDFAPGRFAQSNDFNDAKDQLESQIRVLVMKHSKKTD